MKGKRTIVNSVENNLYAFIWWNCSPEEEEEKEEEEEEEEEEEAPDPGSRSEEERNFKFKEKKTKKNDAIKIDSAHSARRFIMTIIIILIIIIIIINDHHHHRRRGRDDRHQLRHRWRGNERKKTGEKIFVKKNKKKLGKTR